MSSEAYEDDEFVLSSSISSCCHEAEPSTQTIAPALDAVVDGAAVPGSIEETCGLEGSVSYADDDFEAEEESSRDELLRTDLVTRGASEKPEAAHINSFGDLDEYGEESFELDLQDPHSPPTVEVTAANGTTEEEADVTCGVASAEAEHHDASTMAVIASGTGSDDNTIAVDVAEYHQQQQQRQNVNATERDCEKEHIKSRATSLWIMSKIKAIKTRRKTRRRAVGAATTSLIDNRAVVASIDRVTRNRTSNSRLSTPDGTSSVPAVLRTIPRELLKYARVQQLLSEVPNTTENINSGCSIEPQRRPRSLSTFCSVKRQQLESRLATVEVDEMLARWQSGRDDTSVSRGTLELLQHMAHKQREIVWAGTCDGGDSGERVFACMRTRALCLEAAATNARICIDESKRLRSIADRVLRTSAAPTKFAVCCD